MYLSRIAINKRLRKSMQALAFPQMMHAAVLDSFPPALKPEEIAQNRILWRVDNFEEQTWLYVLSTTSPDFSHIIEQFGWPRAGQSWETKDYRPFLERLAVGQQWRFRLHANPTHTVSGKIYAHVTVEQQKQWLLDRAEKNGFQVSLILDNNAEGSEPAVNIIYRNILKFRKHPEDKTFVTLSVATFEGVLVVDDAALLQQTLCAGVGRAKAYGCGLLTLAGLK